MRKLFELLFKRFWLNFALMMGIAILDLIGLKSKLDSALGWIVAFLYLAAFVVYNITKRDGKDSGV